MKQPTTWRQILQRHADRFLKWLDETNSEHRLVDETASHLTEYLIASIRTKDDARGFWDAIPAVRSECNDSDTYERPCAAEAYAYVHLLHRYCRTWSVLHHMTATNVLPLARHGVRVLDVGTGPAPALYAIDDFYRVLRQFAHELGIQELYVADPTLNCIEKSSSMERFIHRFSECCRRPGPFGATIGEFTDLDFRSERKSYFDNYRYETYWDPDEQEYQQWDNSEIAAEDSNALFRYRIVVFSNFLTMGNDVSRYETELRILFRDLRPGAVVIILGATGDHYQAIYSDLARLASDEGLRCGEWDSDGLGDRVGGFLARIKAAQFDVYRHLEGLASASALCRVSHPDYWVSAPSPKTKTKFALRVFRRGKWPASAPGAGG
ncbi:MAG: hypothetical protein OXQ31_04625 [Spirochaetaceae bacterium]|nr:hypothetical protein [Spirochaetaceae bacterium]